MNGNLEIYSKVRNVPKEAQKTIQGGRQRGKTDINPMWRIKTLTEQFGPAGLGWYYEIIKERLEKGTNGEIAAFVLINLYVKFDDEWSKPIQGTGGNSFVVKEKEGFYTDDDCFKKALTDALSVACKALGIGADVYWEKDATKYDNKSMQSKTQQSNNPDASQQSNKQREPINKAQIRILRETLTKKGWSESEADAIMEHRTKCKIQEIPASCFDKALGIANATQSKEEHIKSKQEAS